MTFNMENLEIAVQILGLGWGGSFLVMLIIYLVSLALGRIFPPSDSE